MKITGIETFVVDAGWRPWQFTAVRTDEGITGYGEMSNTRNPFGVIGTVGEFEPILLGQDPLAVEQRYRDMYRMAIQSPGGIAAKAIAGVELALWDIKGKALGVPVYSLFGGPTRERQQVYWSHCGTSRAGNHALIGAPPLRSLDDVRALGVEAHERGFRALKTNIVFPGDPAEVYGPGFGVGAGGRPTSTSRRPCCGTSRSTSARDGQGGGRARRGDRAGPQLQLQAAGGAADLPGGLEPLDMLWVEIDMYDPEALAEVKNSTSVPITSGENLIGLREYRPYFEARSMDTVMIDVPWNGFARSRDVAMAAESYELNVAPHNYYSHLASMHGLHLCATVPNVRIMEIDIDDVPWKDDLTGGPLEITNGELALPTAPGWGVDLDEDVARAHAWERGTRPRLPMGPPLGRAALSPAATGRSSTISGAHGRGAGGVSRTAITPPCAAVYAVCARSC